MEENTLNKLTISGFRGIIGQDLTDKTAKTFATAFVNALKTKYKKENLSILIGRDGRESGKEIEQVLAGTLVSSGTNVTVGGILTTPAVLYLTKTLPYDGAIIITASHNPEEYNGLKFVTSDGFFADKEIIEQIKNFIKQGSFDTGNDKKGEAIFDTTLSANYIDHIISSFTKLKTKPRVIVDTVNSSGSIMAPEFLRGLGAETIALHDEPIGSFQRPPEPNPAALKELGRATLGYQMDVGFGLDPDGDRLVLVDENGIPVFEEYTLALCAKAFYKKLKKENAIESAGPLVINMSTSKTLIDVAKEYGVKTVLSPVGEPNVVKKMQQEKSMFGGEGNGGVIFRPINFCRDSFVGMALILNLMEESGKKISELVAELPKYVMLKEKVENVSNLNDKIQGLKDAFNESEVNEEDGIRFDFKDNSWVQIRASNTEPIVRIYGEAEDEDTIIKLANKAKAAIV